MKKIIVQLYALDSQDRNLDTLTHLKRDFAKAKKLKDMPSNIQILQAYNELLKEKKITKNIQIEHLLKKKSIRSSSWIVAIQVLTKPFACPGNCIFCPNDPTMPKSYIKSEPGAMRALLNHFDPIKQVYNRLLSLQLTGHETDKIEMIVLGWTFDVYTKTYKTKFIQQLYDACNTFDEYFKNIKVSTTQRYAHTTLDTNKKIVYSKTLQEALKKNESANHRIIWLTIETRPEQVTDENCQFRRELGVTRIEMGVQSLDDKILQLNKRGHTVEQARQACHKFRQYGFKFSLHIMPGLYGSSYAKDLKTFKDLYTDPFFKPDEIKFYPTSVIPNTQLCKLYKQGKYKPLETDDIKKLIRQTFLDVIPPYTRIKRLIRDIPANEIVAGSAITNLSQLMHEEMKLKIKNWELKIENLYQRLYGDYKIYKTAKEFLQASVGNGRDRTSKDNIQTSIIGIQPDLQSFRNFVSLDTRSREIRNKPKAESSKLKAQTNLIIRKYVSSGGVEYFISFEDQLGYLYGFTRLLLPTDPVDVKGLGSDTAIIRELHVYGQVEGLHRGKEEKRKGGKVQHKWFGKQLMEIAEMISKWHKYKKLSVISWIGVRAYYRKLGYKKVGEYMVKRI